MSHACLLVVTDNYPSEEELAPMLQPWHEFESTGDDDEYVVNIDITEDAKQAFTKDKKDASQSFVDFLDYYYSYHEKDTCERCKYGYYTLGDDGEVMKVVRRTNPDSKWDWYIIGGRYSGKFELGYDPEKDPANIETCDLCGGTGIRNDSVVQNKECNGCHGEGRRVKWPTLWVNKGNIVRWGALDMEAMLTNNRNELAKVWDKYSISPMREYFLDGAKTKEEFVATAVPVSCFAILKDGHWCERGQLGWWGSVADAKEDWPEQFGTILATIRPDQYVTVIDYHI